MGDRTILITGVTGRQGGTTARELAGKGFRLRGMTRKPDSEKARELESLGVEVVAGDLDNEESLKRAVEGAWGVYGVQNTWEAGVEGEEVQGNRLARVARAAGVEHYVYASVASAHRRTGIPHFENKARIEETVRSLGFPSYTIVRPVFFMENLTTPWFLNGDNLYAALQPDTVLQMIAVEDIGKYGALAFTQRDRVRNRAFDIAGDAATMPAVVDVLSRAFRRKITFVQIPMSEVRKNSADFATMLEWFETVGYDVDIPGLEREFGIKPTTLEQWATRATQ